MTFLDLYVVAMLGNIIVSTLGEWNDHYGYIFCWFWGGLKSFFESISIALPISHICLYMERKFKFFKNANRTN